jgi:hypothetical protein
MKKFIATALVLATLFTTSVNAQVEKKLAKTLELVVARKGGANGASVTWHPEQKKYYAAMAGNTAFFLGVYDAKGTLLSSEDLSTQFDIRGIWYNSATRTIQMNGYSDNGWAEYVLDERGFPSDIKVLYHDMFQPFEQSAGTFNKKDDLVYFLNEDGNIDVYELDGALYLDEIELKLGATKQSGESYSNAAVIGKYNLSTPIYTGDKIGLLNHKDRQVELYDTETGYMTHKLILPTEASVPDFLNFAYCNGIYWLFDTTARIWKGYK